MSTKSINTKVITKINIKIWDKLKITSRKLKSIAKDVKFAEKSISTTLLFFFFHTILLNKQNG